ncbi:MAG: hypothetical protein Athens071425_194 [Parcubacteria group bacterium Athens0714_25]|uniref:Uncharacterized protein n=1 Tax=Candidatus Berkelbacteria bacterium Athens1014_28 TaxID=2017145 RepID=A0A554LPV1_9BACT|nr:MAG: hypothetical protein Athens101428_113 [Candidatus Berkelbacteria bacterium Athens1014_28]TSD02040.1 MAG: hypothetical protein Athens071425_194 [Parcubacteria group bacterium Athens0714_25]
MKAIARWLKEFFMEYILLFILMILTIFLFVGILFHFNPALPKEEIIKKQLTCYQGRGYFLEKFLDNEIFIIRTKPMPIPELGLDFSLAERTSDGMLFNVLIPVGRNLEPKDEVLLFQFQSKKTVYSQFNEFLIAIPKKNNEVKNHDLPKLQ